MAVGGGTSAGFWLCAACRVFSLSLSLPSLLVFTEMAAPGNARLASSQLAEKKNRPCAALKDSLEIGLLWLLP